VAENEICFAKELQTTGHKQIAPQKHFKIELKQTGAIDGAHSG
jgi:hypothetical protein